MKDSKYHNSSAIDADKLFHSGIALYYILFIKF